MKVPNIGGLGRGLDLGNRSNRFAIASAALAGAATLAWRLATDAGDPLWWAIRAGVVVFLAWAVARELAPDHPAIAGLAAVVSAPLLLLGVPDLAATIGMLLAARIVLRSTGKYPSRIELRLVVAFALYLGFSVTAWAAAGALAVALWWDPDLEPRGKARAKPAAITVLVATAVGAGVAAGFGLLDSTAAATGLEAVLQWIAVVVALVGGLFALRPVGVASVDDHFGRPLSLERLRRARALAMAGLALSAIAGAFVGGVGALPSIVAAFLALPFASAIEMRGRAAVSA